MTKIFEVIRKPLLTEKGQILREKNIQVFEVASWASKHQIKEAAELLLQAKVKSIHTVRIPSKTKRLGRWLGSTGVGKKAYIELVDALTPAAE
jgi:large subunit ribosomal protein L23